jgi:hypothetical protein
VVSGGDVLVTANAAQTQLLAQFVFGDERGVAG